jgi:hypothetical protein
MDMLEKAMQEEYFTLVDNYDKPSIVLYGKQHTGSHTKDGEFIDDFQFCIGQMWRDDEEGFSMHHIKSYERLRLWLNQNTTGGYRYYVDLYENRLKK